MRIEIYITHSKTASEPARRSNSYHNLVGNVAMGVCFAEMISGPQS